MSEHTDAKYTVELIFVWALVGIPLIWGVYETCVKAAKLFQ